VIHLAARECTPSRMASDAEAGTGLRPQDERVEVVSNCGESVLKPRLQMNYAMYSRGFASGRREQHFGPKIDSTANLAPRQGTWSGSTQMLMESRTVATDPSRASHRPESVHPLPIHVTLDLLYIP